MSETTKCEYATHDSANKYTTTQLYLKSSAIVTAVVTAVVKSTTSISLELYVHVLQHMLR